MSENTKGIIAIALACTIWGLSGMYYKALDHVPPLEVLCHRTLWSLVFFAGVLAVQGRLGTLKTLILGSQVKQAAFAAVMISGNWFSFIYAVQSGRALEASLGYYIFPLVAVLLGVIFWRERLSRAQWVAVAMAAVAVLVLTIGIGAAPWLAFSVAGTFSMYGLMKKGLDAGPVASVTAEVVLLSPLALIWLWGVHFQGWTGVTGVNVGAFGDNLHDTLMLMFAGVLTGTPLVLFSYAARRISYGMVGLMEYINPSFQFLVATFVFREVVTPWHLFALPVIWVALALYSTASFRQDRALSKRAASAGTSSTKV